MRQLIAVALFCIGIFCVAQAQVPMTGAGLGAPSSGGGGYTGPGDKVSGAIAWWGLRAYSAAKTGTKIANVCNSGDANCADINSLSSGNFDVTTAQGSPLNCGGAGGTCTIKTLYDQSGGTNCSSAACDVTNATAANRPTLVFNCINTSLPCMSFNGTTQQLTSSASLSSQVQPYTFSHVSNPTNNSGAYPVIGATVTQVEAYYGCTADFACVYAGGAAAASASATFAQNHSVQAIANGTSSALYVDGTGTSPGSSIGTTAYSGIIAIGGNAFSGFMNGKIMEVGFWDSDFSASSFANASAMCHNQFNYWATVTSC